jgi:hypothetical protein
MRCKDSPDVVVPGREFEQFVRKAELSPHVVERVIVLLLEFADQLVETRVLGADLLLEQVSALA